MIEYSQLFRRSLGVTSDVVSKEMFSFQDVDGSDVCLRPEGTAGVCVCVNEKEEGKHTHTHSLSHSHSLSLLHWVGLKWVCLHHFVLLPPTTPFPAC